MSKSNFETGAPNAQTNDFILTAINDQDMYNELVLWAWNAHTSFMDHRHKQLRHMSPDDTDKLNFGFINDYMRKRREELKEEDKE